MLKVIFTHRFKKEYKKIAKTEEQKREFKYVVDLLRNRQILPYRYKDHQLKGKLSGYRDCHICPDWVLIYRVIEDKLILELSRTGTHSNILEK